jgi:stage V sporulation protein SpoVS
MDVQLDILRVERERVEATKAKLFGATSVDVIEQKIRDKKAVVRDVMRVVKSQAVVRGYLQRKKFNQLCTPAHTSLTGP